MIHLLRKEDNFSPADYSENKEKLRNPSRGWYRIFYFDVCEKPDFEEIERELVLSHSLVMIFVDISSLKTDEMGEDVKENLNAVLDFFYEKKYDIILRFAYDRVGKAMETEPSRFDRVLLHAKQLIDVVNENHKGVFILQGLMLGNWGEMHTSRYINDDKFSEIYEIYNEVDESIYLAVRKPSQWRVLNRAYAKTNSLEGIRTGIFDDGMFGSDTDLGTFGTKSKADVGYRSEWNPSEEYDFLELLSKKFPMGGECVLDKEKTYSDFSFMIARLEKSGITYLNDEHDIDLISLWENTKYQGSGVWKDETVFDYIDAHLGYRFVINGVKFKKDKNGFLNVSVTVKNTGFAPMYQECDAYIKISDFNGTEMHEIKGGLNNLNSGETKVLSASFKKDKGFVTVCAKRSVDEAVVFFAASTDAKGNVILGKLE